MSKQDDNYVASAINPNLPKAAGEATVVKGYGFIGTEVDPSLNNCLAKVGEAGLVANHFVRAEGSSFFNPNTTDQSLLKNYKFKRVPVSAFNLYLQFLRGGSQNMAMLSQAQREV